MEAMVPLWVLEDMKKKALEQRKHWETEEQTQVEGNMQDHARGVQYGVNSILLYIESAIEVFGRKEASAATETSQENQSTESLPHVCEHCEQPCDVVNRAFNGGHVDICEDCSNNMNEFRRCDECNVLTHTSDLFTTEKGDEICISCNEKYAAGPDEDAAYDEWKNGGIAI